MKSNNFINSWKDIDIIDFIKNEELMLPIIFDNCPLYIVKEDIGVGFYLQYEENRDYSKIREFVSSIKPKLNNMLEEEREKKLLAIP